MEASQGDGKAIGHWRHTGLLVVLGATWGLQFALLKIATTSALSELGILSLCMALLAAAYLATLTIRGKLYRPNPRQLRFFAISGFFGFVLPLGGIILVADRLAAGLIVLYTEALIPVFTFAIVLALRSERPSRRRLIAIALALVGVAFAFWPEVVGSTDARIEGLLLVLVVPLAYSIDAIYVAARWPSDLRALQVVSGEAVAGTAMLLPIWLLSGGLGELPSALGTGEWAILAFVPVSYLEVYLYFYLLRHAGAVFVSFGSFIALFAGFFWGWALLDETHPSTVWIAVALVALALYLIATRGRPAESAAPVPQPAPSKNRRRS